MMDGQPLSEKNMNISNNHNPQSIKNYPSINADLQRIRGDLSDIDGTNITLIDIIDKVQQLTEAESAVMKSQRAEIKDLKRQLDEAIKTTYRQEVEVLKEEGQILRQGERKCARHIIIEQNENDSTLGASFVGWLQSNSSSTDDLERNSSCSQSANGFPVEIKQVSASLVEVDDSKVRIYEEIHTLKEQVKVLVEERTTLIKEIEVYSHLSDVATELEHSQNLVKELQEQVIELQEEVAQLASDKQRAIEKADAEAMACEELVQEKMDLMKENSALEKQLKLKNMIALRANYTKPPLYSLENIRFEKEIAKLKKEIEVVRAENESLRDVIEKQNENICLTADENVDDDEVHSREEPQESSSLKERMRNSIQGSTREDDQSGEYRSSMNDEENRLRLESTGSVTKGSHESDNVSVLFGQDSIAGKSVNLECSEPSCDDQSDHKSIRAHAERLLYWANKATERNSKVINSPGSIASTSPVVLRQQSIPTTIGLTPRRSRSKHTKSLPPRPPSFQQEDGMSGSEKNDKENGGTSFNIMRRKTFDKGVIFNLEKVQTEASCRCSSSPFSGNDANAEFYLPKLGLACTCGQSSVAEDREAFAKNPTSLSNILRKWQCDFLQSLNLLTADQFLRAHKRSANEMTKKMKQWREDNNMSSMRSKECYVALMVWSRTAKVVMRSIKKQQEAGEEFIEKPGFLDISYADTNTVCSVSTLGQLSSGGMRVNEMMEI